MPFIVVNLVPNNVVICKDTHSLACMYVEIGAVPYHLRLKLAPMGHSPWRYLERAIADRRAGQPLAALPR